MNYLTRFVTATPKGLAVFRISMMALLLGLMAQLPAQAQSASDLKHEIDLLKQDLVDMQRYVYQGKEPDKIPDLSATGGASNVTGQLQVQIQRLEQELRKMNGRFEEVDHQIMTLEGRLDRLITDVDYRLRAIEGQLSGQPVANNGAGSTSNMQSNVIYPTDATQSANTITTTNANGTTIVSSQGTQVAPGGELAAGQQSLGQLTPEQLTAFANGETPNQPQVLSPTATQTATTPPPTLETAPAPSSVASTSTAAPGSVAPTGATTQEQYNNAIALLSKRDFDSAEVALTQFLAVNPDDPLAGNAMYWLGETHYAREDFRQAVAIFADSYTKYPEGGKLTDSLLKLAMSLEAINQVEVACTSYRTLLDEHSDARQRVLSIAEKAVTKLNCP